jgi:hypothetical protein
MAKIRVPPTPKEAFDPNRPPGTLLRTQIAHLEHAVLSRGLAIRTEGEAADYIGQLPALLGGEAPKTQDPPAAPRKAAKPPAKRRSRRK